MSEQRLLLPDRFTIYAMPADSFSLMPERALPGEPISLEIGRNALGLLAQGYSYFEIATRVGLEVAEIPGKVQEVQAFFGASTLAQTTCLAHESGTIRTPVHLGPSWLQLSDSAVEAARLARNGFDGSPDSAEAMGVDPFDTIPMIRDLLHATNAGSSMPRAMHTLYANNFFTTPDPHTQPYVLFKAVGAETLSPDEFAEAEADPFMQAIIHPQSSSESPGSWTSRQLLGLYGHIQEYDNWQMTERFDMHINTARALGSRVAQLIGVEERDQMARQGFRMGVFGALLPVDLQTWRTAITTPPNPWF